MRSTSLVGVLLLSVVLGAGSRALWVWLDRPVERVSIRGELEYLGADDLRDRLAPLVRGRTWLSVDLDALRQQVLGIGWLAEVEVSREWPDALAFKLTEQRPVARWHDDRLLNADGEPFAFGAVPPSDDLPDLAGPPGSGAEVLAFHHRLSQRLAALELGVTQLRLEARGAWRFQLDDGVWVMLGRNDHAARLARLSTVWNQRLGERARDIRYIDLRYPNGVAVAWHGETRLVDERGDRQG